MHPRRMSCSSWPMISATATSGASEVARSVRRTSIAWPRRAHGSPVSTSGRRCARRVGRRCSPAAIPIASAWPAHSITRAPPASRPGSGSSRRACRAAGTRRPVSASGTSASIRHSGRLVVASMSSSASRTRTTMVRCTRPFRGCRPCRSTTALRSSNWIPTNRPSRVDSPKGRSTSSPDAASGRSFSTCHRSCRTCRSSHRRSGGDEAVTGPTRTSSRNSTHPWARSSMRSTPTASPTARS